MVGEERLHSAQGHFGQLAKFGDIQAMKLPIDIRAVKDRQAECIGVSAVSEMTSSSFVLGSASQQALELRIPGEILDRERNAFDDFRNRIFESADVLCD